MREFILSLIKKILEEAEKRGISVGRVRLVKLLYLLEVEYYRLYQKRLTSLKWRFYHYGPYPLEIEEMFGSPELEEEEINLSEDRIFHKLKIMVREPEEKYMEPEIERLIRRVVEEWGGLDLRYLLDYVYFETEPMIGAEQGDILDFSKTIPWQKTKTGSIKQTNKMPALGRIKNRKKLEELRKRIKEHLKGLPAPGGVKFRIDKMALENLKIWNEDASQVNIKGKVEME